MRDDPGRADVVRVRPDALWTAVRDAIDGALGDPGLVGLVVAEASVGRARRAVADHSPVVLGADPADDEWTPGHRLHLVPAPLAKGLEFDRVVLVEPADLVAAEPDERTGLRRLYVCLTRAVSGLVVVHAEPLPAALSGARLAG